MYPWMEGILVNLLEFVMSRWILFWNISRGRIFLSVAIFHTADAYVIIGLKIVL